MKLLRDEKHAALRSPLRWDDAGVFVILDLDFDEDLSPPITVGECEGYALRWFPAYAGDNKPINVHA